MESNQQCWHVVSSVLRMHLGLTPTPSDDLMCFTERIFGHMVAGKGVAIVSEGGVLSKQCKGGMRTKKAESSRVTGPIRWCVWSFRLSSPLRLPHLNFLFVCLYIDCHRDCVLYSHCNRWRSGWCSWSWALSCLDTCFGISTAWLVVWKPLCLDPSDGVFGRFDLAALCGCHTLNVCCC